MNLKEFLLLMGLIFPVLMFGQGESNNWYFGENAGITFSADGATVTALTDGQVNTIEGCATASSSDGNLLFYTDGSTVYNASHTMMTNGNDLYGQISSSQSAIIVPWPQNPNLYYIFTARHRDPEFSFPNQGLHYSVVDITADNGNGEVIEKNTMLRNATAEKIAAVVKDCAAESIWIVTLGTDDSPLIQPSRRNNLDTYHAFEITAAGVNPTSVQSPSPNINIDRDGAEGYLKFSPDGTRMASANMDRGLFIYNFDTATGVISNEQQLFLGGSNLHPYGIEFSPNGRYLYTHSSSSRPIFRNSSLFQFDLQATDISNSRFNVDPVHENFDLTRGALQLGPDGKIYRALQQGFNISGQALGTNFLGVINNPDVGGVGSNYVHNGVDLNRRNSFQGLPPSVISFFNTVDLIPDSIGQVVADYEVCEGQPLMLETQYIPGATYEWRNGNGDIVTDGDANEHIHNINTATLADAGNYIVTITKSNAQACPITGTLDVIVRPLPVTSSNMLFVCDSDSDTTDGITTLDLTQLEDTANFTYTYFESMVDRDAETNSITNPINYTNSSPSQTIYYNAVSAATGCSNSAELQLEVGIIIPFTLDTSYFICAGNPTVTINGPVGYDSYQWIRVSDDQVISTDIDIDISATDDYRLETTMNYSIGGNNYSCTTEAVFNVLQSSLSSADLIPNGMTPVGGSSTICQNQNLTLEATAIPGGTYVWSKDGVALSNPGNTLQITATALADAGDYEVIVTDPAAASCSVTASLNIVVDATITDSVVTMQTCDTDTDNPNDGFTDIDLTTIEDPAFTYTYYETIADRTAGIVIPNPSNYRNTNVAYTPIVYFSTLNSLGCEDFGEIQITINTVTPLILDENYWICPESPSVTISAPDGYDSYEWFRIVADTLQLVSSNQDFTTVEVGEYVLEVSSSFTIPTETISCSSSITVNVLASSLSSVDLIPNGTPVENDFTVCEGQPLVLETQEITGATYAWEKDNLIINNPNGHILQITTTSGLDTGIYSVTVTPPDALSCPITGTLTILVNPALVVPDSALITCDTDSDISDDGITTINLRQIEDNSSLIYSYFESTVDRDTNNAITNTENYRNTIPFDQIIYVKATNSLGCETFAELQIEVRNAMEIDLVDIYWLCSANPTINIQGPVGFDTYQWFRLNGTSEELISIEQDIVISETGEYLLEAGINFSNNNETVNCTNLFVFGVFSSITPEISEILVEGENNINQVEVIVLVDGDFEFSLDGVSYQDSNIFNNVPPGSTTVYVQDKNGCGSVEETIEIEVDPDSFGFPKFFTPNGDGINDFWQFVPPPTGTAEELDIEIISIFNRYGDLLRQINPDSSGWDGRFKGTPLPSSDYWFKASLVDNKEIQGHFALKR